MLKLKSSIGTNYRVDPNDLMNAKRALSDLGYYDVPPHRGINDWTDDAMFDGIKRFQKDNGLKVDGFMRPEGPTERKINASLTENGPGLGEGETPPPGSSKDYLREPGNNMPIIVPPTTDPNMPMIKKYPYRYPAKPYQKDGNPIVEGIDPRTGFPIPPHKGPY